MSHAAYMAIARESGLAALLGVGSSALLEL
jgi:hypothetical protein